MFLLRNELFLQEKVIFGASHAYKRIRIWNADKSVFWTSDTSVFFYQRPSVLVDELLFPLL